MKPAERLMAERVMVCLSSKVDASRVVHAGARTAARLVAEWFAVYVETPRERADIFPENADALERNMALASALGATVVRVSAGRASDGLIAFAQREGITHIVFGESGRSQWERIWHGSTIDRMLSAVRWAATQVVPLDAADDPSPRQVERHARHDGVGSK
jgi:two-component system, OmpR family, sensor histidine kinase KdpD